MRRSETSRACAFSAAVTVRPPGRPHGCRFQGALPSVFPSSMLLRLPQHEGTTPTRCYGIPVPRGARTGRSAQESLAEAFWAVARRLRHQTQQRLAPWDVTPPPGPRARRARPPRRRSASARSSEHLRIAPRSATEVVDALEERGLVERRPDPADRRATLVALTDARRARWPPSIRRRPGRRGRGVLRPPRRRRPRRAHPDPRHPARLTAHPAAPEVTIEHMRNRRTVCRA